MDRIWPGNVFNCSLVEIYIGWGSRDNWVKSIHVPGSLEAQPLLCIRVISALRDIVQKEYVFYIALWQHCKDITSCSNASKEWKIALFLISYETWSCCLKLIPIVAEGNETRLNDWILLDIQMLRFRLYRYNMEKKNIYLEFFFLIFFCHTCQWIVNWVVLSLIWKLLIIIKTNYIYIL